MKKLSTLVLLFIYSISSAQFFEKDEKVSKFNGFFDFYYNAENGKLFLQVAVDQLEEEFLYVSALSQGLGSNDIGLDRGQLGGEAVVYFERYGNKLLLTQPNQDYRAITSNEAEQNSVKEAFAKSVLFGFKIEKEHDGYILIDLTPFVIRDQHGVANRLKSMKQGNFSMDNNSSVVDLKRTKAFPENVEFEAFLSFKGQVSGRNLASVSPSGSRISVGQHHSFVKLPDLDYTPRAFDPRSGSFFISYMDYSTPVYEPIVKRFIARHRLEKKNPNAEVSEAIEPIIYYLDPGTPEPVRSALLDGARWWNQAFESAGFKNAFQVEMLPEGADPLDVRYNVIQWVHRSTRGWSYGASVTDPRTGEIIKGHVSLGSLRIRQDYLIATALSSPFTEDQDEMSKEALEMALARIRQLAAHEVGHTLGFAHNFAASTNNRASVMDYPHPMIVEKNGKIDFSQAYDTGIGDWDRIAVAYAYGVYDDEKNELNALLNKAEEEGYRFISDQDARSPGGAHAYAHLWDNGESASEELNRVLDLRAKAMSQFSTAAVPVGRTYSEIEDAFVPLYFYHRYQTEATAKLIGGMVYTYQVKGSSQQDFYYLNRADQEAALQAVLNTLSVENLSIPSDVLKLFPPRAFGYARTRESFKGETGMSFDALSAGKTAAEFSLSFLLHPERAARLIDQNYRFPNQLGLNEVLDELTEQTWYRSESIISQNELQNSINFVVLKHMMNLGASSSNPQVKALTASYLKAYAERLKKAKLRGELQAYAEFTQDQINAYFEHPEDFKLKMEAKIPDGSPIGQE